jgi:hypothetical protein
MEWMKKNAALALGMGLPVALIAFFALAATLPKLWVAPPKYDLLYVTGYNPSSVNSLHFTVQNRHVSFFFLGENYGNNMHLYRYSAVTGESREIRIALADMPVKKYNPQARNQPQIDTQISVPATDVLSVDPSNPSPDGYLFSSGYAHSPGLIGDIFFSSHGHNTAALTKNGYTINITNDAGNPYGYTPVTLIGWIVP